MFPVFPVFPVFPPISDTYENVLSLNILEKGGRDTSFQDLPFFTNFGLPCRITMCYLFQVSVTLLNLKSNSNCTDDVMITLVKSRNYSDPKSQARKPIKKSEALGQVFTSHELAKHMVRGLGITTDFRSVRLLDPCVGPATFLKALKEVGVPFDAEIDAFDIDPEMVHATRSWRERHGQKISVSEIDYLETYLDKKYDYAILNPPYIRQEWIVRKDFYRDLFNRRYGIDVPGTANLYVYFIIKVLEELKEGGKVACIVYDSWQYTRFGQWLYNHLLSVCNDLRIEPVPGLPFHGRLIDATIIYAEKKGMGTVSCKQAAAIELDTFTSSIYGMSQITSLFSTKRGLRLKQADFFMTHIDRAEVEGSQPFTKKVNLIEGYSVPENHPEAVLLLTENEGDDRTYRELNRRINKAKSEPEANVSILTWHRERPTLWAQHNSAPRAPILFNYFIRRHPRHIYNPSRIYSDNFYGLKPLKNGSVLAWVAVLNSTASTIGILEQARNQGSGLAKLQLFEYRRARVIDISKWSKADIEKMSCLGELLVNSIDSPEKIIAAIDDLVCVSLGDPRLNPHELQRVLSDVDKRARRPK